MSALHAFFCFRTKNFVTVAGPELSLAQQQLRASEESRMLRKLDFTRCRKAVKLKFLNECVISVSSEVVMLQEQVKQLEKNRDENVKSLSQIQQKAATMVTLTVTNVYILK